MAKIKSYFARVARSTSAPYRREEPINASYTTPTTTRTRRTPVTTESKLKNYTTPKTTRSYNTPKTTRGLQTPANSGKTRHYTKPTLIYRPLELDSESSSASSVEILQCMTPPITPEKRVKEIEDGRVEEELPIIVPAICDVVQEEKVEKEVPTNSATGTCDTKEDKVKEVEKVEKVMPNFVPGTCDIEEIMRRYGIKRNPKPGSDTTTKQTEVIVIE